MPIFAVSKLGYSVRVVRQVRHLRLTKGLRFLCNCFKAERVADVLQNMESWLEMAKAIVLKTIER